MRRNVAFIALALLSLASACGQDNQEQKDSVSLSNISEDASLNSDSVSSEESQTADSPSSYEATPYSGTASESETSSSEDSQSSEASSDEETIPDSGDSSEESNGGESTPNCLKLLTSLDEVKACKKVAMVVKDGSNYYGYTGVAKEKYSWYHLGESLTAVSGHDDLLKLGTSTKELILTFSSDKVSVKVGDSYLWGGMVTSSESTHANLGLKSEETFLNIADLGNGDFNLYSDDGVYVEYYKGSFCGAASSYKDKAIVSFYTYFYEKGLDSADSGDSTDHGDDPIDSTDGNEYWSTLDLTKTGNEFRADLQKLIKNYKTNSTSYKGCMEIGAAAAAYPVGSKTFVPFYHAAPNVSEGVSGNGAMTTTTGSCNKEHTWPNSRGCGKSSGPAADPFIIRPTLTKENSSRSNYFYGYSSSNEWDPASCGYEYARGEAARVILYAATAYYGTCGSGGSSSGNEPMELSNNPSDNKDKHTMGTLKTLLEWNEKYAPTAMEIQINNYLCEKGYGRNPFVDEPKFASYIWDSNGVRA